MLGRLHWASNETAPAYAGHIEGAIRAGTLAADTIVRLLDAAPDPAPDAADPLTPQRWAEARHAA